MLEKGQAHFCYMKKILSLSLAAFVSFSVFISCSESQTEPAVQRNTIDVTPIVATKTAEGTEVNANSGAIGYHCTSNTSSVVCDIYPEGDFSEATTVIYNEGTPSSLIRFHLDPAQPDGSCRFVTYNESYEPLITGIFNQQSGYISFDYIFPDTVQTKSMFGWACNMSLGTAGLIWSTAAGAVSMGAGFVVGLAFTAFTYWACDTGEEAIRKRG